MQHIPVYALQKHHLGKKKGPEGRKGIVTQPKFEMQGSLKKKIGLCKLKKKKQHNTKPVGISALKCAVTLQGHLLEIGFTTDQFCWAAAEAFDDSKRVLSWVRKSFSETAFLLRLGRSMQDEQLLKVVLQDSSEALELKYRTSACKF